MSYEAPFAGLKVTADATRANPSAASRNRHSVNDSKVRVAHAKPAIMVTRVLSGLVNMTSPSRVVLLRIVSQVKSTEYGQRPKWSMFQCGSTYRR